MKHTKTILIIFSLVLANLVSSQSVIETDKNYGLKDKEKNTPYGGFENMMSEKIDKPLKGQFNSQILSKEISYDNNLNNFIQSQTSINDKTRYLPYIFGGSGIVAAGGALILHYMTDQKYQDYQDAQTPGDATRLYNDVENLELARDVSLGVSAVMIVWGIMSYLDKPTSQPIDSNFSFYFGPGQNMQSVGLGLQIRLDNFNK